MTLEAAAEAFVDWLGERVVGEGRGDFLDESSFKPSGCFWLGRLAPWDSVIERGGGDRGQRLDPCAMGMKVLLDGQGPWDFVASVAARAWLRPEPKRWTKTDLATAEVACRVESTKSQGVHGREQLPAALDIVTGERGLSMEVHTEVTRTPAGLELAVTLVNTSPMKHKALKDTNLYECSLAVSGLRTCPFMLEALPDAFRYDRRVAAYGINCGVDETAGVLMTVDAPLADRFRPVFWSVAVPEPDLSFRKLSADPLDPLRSLVDLYREWGGIWETGVLRARGAREGWNEEMFAEAEAAARDYHTELDRMRRGLLLLDRHDRLLRAFRLMNASMAYSSAPRGYDAWRPFQIGFLLANLDSIVEPSRGEGVADVLWFPTGGGKTETYLGLLVVAAFHDRLTGKKSGITAWSRFPLRMLSLQQTQRFADAIAGAELVRRNEGIEGDPFSVGFFVGQSGTPNRIDVDPYPGMPDPDDETMPSRYRVLSKCPFCHRESIGMEFNRREWTLDHVCKNDACPWEARALPFYIVDEEIYRFLPTVIVGTLDKAASIAWQAAMRGFIGAPYGRCSVDGHGFTYAPRAKKPSGCLVPGCRGEARPLEADPDSFAPSFRLQDELHLLKDSLGAVDAHYEALLDSLQEVTSGRRPKVLASSATLTGYERQVAVLYRRTGRVFPVPGLSSTDGFWISDSSALMRRYVALAPRGVTLEYCVDRVLTVLQRAVRRLESDPEATCREIGIESCYADSLLSIYGTNVVYGNTLRDLDAVERSVETQVPVDGALNTASLTGRTAFETVRKTLKRLEEPEPSFGDRLHVITASSMMSHGVDIDRLNVMVMLGLPLTTAEFIQATARVGRKWPALVFVTHKIAREREAGVYHSFEKYIQHGDRFVEPVPITRRSRRVLEATISGLEQARIYMIHEALAKSPLTVVSKLRAYARSSAYDADREVAAIVEALELNGALDEGARRQLESWFERFFDALDHPTGNARFPSDLFPTGKPMLSMRDVEEQAPIHKRLD